MHSMDPEVLERLLERLARYTPEDLSLEAYLTTLMRVAEGTTKCGDMDLKTILQLRWKEKNNNELQPLPDCFYTSLIPKLAQNDKDNKLVPHLEDLLYLRIAKIASYAYKRIPVPLVENLTPEERIFYEHLLRMFNLWVFFIEQLTTMKTQKIQR